MFQSFIDELAHAAGKDPLQFRLDLLAQPRAGRRPERGADGFDAGAHARRWCCEVGRREVRLGHRKLPAGTGMGIAFHFSHHGYFAEVAEVSVDAKKRVKVNKVWVVGDIGSQIINPLHAENLVQGGVIDGISHLMGRRSRSRAAARCRPTSTRSSAAAHDAGAAGDRGPLGQVQQPADRARRAVAAADPSGRRQRDLRGDRERVRALPLNKSGYQLGVAHVTFAPLSNQGAIVSCDLVHPRAPAGLLREV